ncbi:MAG TPA: hypothetical protein VMS18_12235 [Candidatus Binatia bacterium]|nr:hypothetical protein [Candidatus Binatia bacterium]
MKILLHEGTDTTGAMGWYECMTDLKPGMTISIPGGRTFDIQGVIKNQTGTGGEPLQHWAVFSVRSSVPANTVGVMPLVVSTECQTGDGFKQKFASASQAVGAYDESLKGMARTIEHMNKSEQLHKQSHVARVAFDEHRSGCRQCSKTN